MATRTKAKQYAALWRLQGGLCWICRKPVDLSLHVHDPMGPSFDHLVPRARGGRGRAMNRALAHKSCNGKRSCEEAVSRWAAVMLTEHFS